jgi:hypothetical protein
MGLFLLIYPSRPVQRVLLIAPDIRSTPRLAKSDSGFAFALSEPGCLLPFFGIRRAETRISRKPSNSAVKVGLFLHFS